MATTDLMAFLTPAHFTPVSWFFVKFTSGSTEPSKGDTIWGDTSNANAVLEYIEVTSGTFGGNDAAGFMLLSNDNGTAFASGENFTANTTTAANHGTLTGIPTAAGANPDTSNETDVLDFDASSNEVALFKCFMPQNYDGGGLTVKIGVTSTTATGDMSWHMFLKSITADVDNLVNVGVDPSGLKVFAEPQKNAAFDAASVAGEVAVDTIVFTNGAQMDSIAAGEMFFLLLMRDAQDTTNDDMAADAELQFIAVEET